MPDTSHLVAALVGAWLAAPVCLVVGAWLAGGKAEDERRHAYAEGRKSAYAAMTGHPHRTARTQPDDGSRLLGEIADGYELSQTAEWSKHG
jgi:hypothetical protein